MEDIPARCRGVGDRSTIPTTASASGAAPPSLPGSRGEAGAPPPGTAAPPRRRCCHGNGTGTAAAPAPGGHHPRPGLGGRRFSWHGSAPANPLARMNEEAAQKSDGGEKCNGGNQRRKRPKKVGLGADGRRCGARNVAPALALAAGPGQVARAGRQPRGSRLGGREGGLPRPGGSRGGRQGGRGLRSREPTCWDSAGEGGLPGRTGE